VRIDEIFEAEHGSLEGRELDVLVDLVEFYESKNFPMESSNITEESGEIINRSRADLVLA
jgi:hypothetical protein